VRLVGGTSEDRKAYGNSSENALGTRDRG